MKYFCELYDTSTCSARPEFSTMVSTYCGGLFAIILHYLYFIFRKLQNHRKTEQKKEL